MDHDHARQQQQEILDRALRRGRLRMQIVLCVRRGFVYNEHGWQQ